MLGVHGRVARVAVLAVVCVLFGACGGAERDERQPPAAGGEMAIPAPVERRAEETSRAPASAPAELRAPHASQSPDSPSAACLGVAAQAPARSVAVHRWTDADGIVHYSDRPPPETARDRRLIEVSGLPPIEVRVRSLDGAPPAGVEQRALADALGVQRALRDELGVAPPPGMRLDIVFVSSADLYAREVGEPELAASDGAYSAAQRRILVRLQEPAERNFVVLRHEMVHALLRESVGNLPVPLNEGLAEYFGRFRAGGMGGQVDLSASRGALIAAAPSSDGSGALVDLLARSGRDFYLDDGASSHAARYARAHALIALLMRDAASRTVLTGLLRAQRADPCTPIVAEQLLDAAWPGGLAALATDLADFMRDPPAQIITF